MNDHETIGRDHAQHPEDVLAAYVDGSASGDERATAQALVASCSDCRREVDLAVHARAALQSLPELDSSELAPAGRAPAPATARHPSGFREWTRQWRWERVAGVAGVVAVGSLVALFVLLQSGGPASRDGVTTLGRSNSPRSNTGSMEGGQGDYTATSLDALARQLVASDRTDLAAKQPGSRTTQAPVSGQTAETTSRGNPNRAIRCLRTAGGLGPSARPVHVEAAGFQGTPAFVGAFVHTVTRDARQYLVVLAADRASCSPLYVINRSL